MNGVAPLFIARFRVLSVTGLVVGCSPISAPEFEQPETVVPADSSVSPGDVAPEDLGGGPVVEDMVTVDRGSDLVDDVEPVDSSDDGSTGTRGPFFPIPQAGSGEAAWWRMEWIESPGTTAECSGPFEDFPSLALVVVDDEAIPGAVTQRVVRDEACMYWGGENELDFEQHVLSATLSALGPAIVIRGYTIRTRQAREVQIGRTGAVEHSFKRSGVDPIAIRGFMPDSELPGQPIVSLEPVTGDFSIGEFGGFEPLAPKFQLLDYPDEESRRNGEAGTQVGDGYRLRMMLRETLVDGIETQYVLLSVMVDPALAFTCEEWWYQRGVGPYAMTWYSVDTWAECEALAAVNDPNSVSSPLAHFEENQEKTRGWAVRRDYCIGPECFVRSP